MAGVYEMDYRDHPQDRYSEWKELELLPDKTCILYHASAGHGGTDKTVKKRGKWSVKEGTNVVLNWDWEASTVINLNGWPKQKPVS